MPDLFEEKKYLHNSERVMIGVDEVGRGCWAGPVLSCASYIYPSKFKSLPKINDSKKLSKKDRRKVLVSSSTFSKYSIGCSTVKEIEKFGINASNDLAALRAVVLMIQNFNFITKKKLFFDIFLDGNRLPKFKIFKELYDLIRNRIKIYSIVRGDSKVMSIALASIIAKETRDTIMFQQHLLYPQYNFKNNVGYGTKEHREMIIKCGITKIHRRNFKPISTIFCT
ncbi:ribonuclease HII [Alphaproteobacteria bacterium]|nr:ribonuclease HII [Alphaproteobacteria bacterium]